MNTDQFKVIYTGSLLEGFEINTVAEQFSARFKITLDKALGILKADRELTLVKQVELLKAHKHKSAFENIGLQIRLERILSLVSNQDLENNENKNLEEEKEDEKEEDIKIENAGATNPHSEANAKLASASDSWTLDPLHTKDESNENLDDTDDDASGQPKRVAKADFNYTGLSNSPVINSHKIQNETKDSQETTKENDNIEEKEKSGFGKTLSDFIKRIFKHT